MSTHQNKLLRPRKALDLTVLFLNKMSHSRKLLIVAMALELVFILLCILPMGNSINPFDTTRLALQVCLTILLLLAGLYGRWLTHKGYMLHEVSLCLILIPAIHLTACGAQEGIAWVPILLGFGSLAVAIPLAWHNT